MAADTAAPSVVAKRWPIAVAGILMQMFLGTVYAWSAFKKPLLEAHQAQGWSAPQVGLAFTLVILCIGLAAAFGGRLVDRAGSRRVATVGALLFALGTVCAGIADAYNSLWLLWIGYGVIGGLGNGLGYITPIAVLVRWFPDRRGMITGLAVMGFGLGAAVMGFVVPLVLPTLGIAHTFVLSGGLFLVGMLIAARQLNNPPAGWQAPASGRATARKAPDAVPCELREALRMSQFYILWALMFFNITAGLMLISNLSPFAQAQLHIDPKQAGVILLITALANGLGRIVWAALSDLIGRKPTFLLLVGTQIPLFLLLPHITGFAMFTAVCSYLLLCYGGGFGSMPAFAADTFGTRCMGEIYGKILLAWGIAGIVGPTVMDYVQKTYGSYSTALQVAAVLLAGGFLLALCYRRPSPSPIEAPGQRPGRPGQLTAPRLLAGNRRAPLSALCRTDPSNYASGAPVGLGPHGGSRNRALRAGMQVVTTSRPAAVAGPQASGGRAGEGRRVGATGRGWRTGARPSGCPESSTRTAGAVDWGCERCLRSRPRLPRWEREGVGEPAAR